MRRAFTLVELLIAVTILAILISLLLVALAGAKGAAGSAVCLSNLKQIGAAFTMYDFDYDAFPNGGEDWYSTYSWRFGVGGVHHYGLDDGGNAIWPEDMPLDLLVGARPLNAYVGRDRINGARDRVWQCPNDDGIFQPAAAEFGLPTHPWWKLNITDQDSGSVYAYLGTSYENNRFMYHDGGHGFGDPAGYVIHDYAMRDVDDLSMFVLCGDAGGITIAETGNWNPAKIRGDWHGMFKCQMATADGSARLFDILSSEDENGEVKPTTVNGYTFKRRIGH